MGNLAGWKMIHPASGGEVLPGTKQLDFRGEECTVLGATVPPEGNSTGRVAYTDSKGYTSECYPQVFGIRLVPEDDNPAEIVHIDVPDTVEDLLSGDPGRKGKAMQIPGGEAGVLAILTEVGEAPIMDTGQAVADAVAKAYALGFVEGKAGREPAFPIAGHIIKRGSDDCPGCPSCGN